MTGTFCLVMTSGFHRRCVQIVRHFRCNIQSREHDFVLSASTDGSIALWDITRCIDAFLHKSCIAQRYGNTHDCGVGAVQCHCGTAHSDGYVSVAAAGGAAAGDGSDVCDGDDGGAGRDEGDCGGGDEGDGGLGDGAQYSHSQCGYSAGVDSGSEGDCNDDDFYEDCSFDRRDDDNQVRYKIAGEDPSYIIKNRTKIHSNFYNSTQLHSNSPVCSDSHKPLHVFNAHQSGIHSLSVLSSQGKHIEVD